MNRVYPIEKSKIDEMRDALNKGKWGKRNLMLFNFMLGVPLRVSDVLNLKVKDLKEMDIFTITPRKSKRKGKNGVKSKGKKVDYDIHPLLQQEIMEYVKDMDDEDYLFPSQKGNNPLTRQGVWEIIKKAAIKVGIKEPIGCHSTRKTHARILFEDYDDIAFVMEQLGQTNPVSTMKYLHLTDEKRKERIYNSSLFK